MGPRERVRGAGLGGGRDGSREADLAPRRGRAVQCRADPAPRCRRGAVRGGGSGWYRGRAPGLCAHRGGRPPASRPRGVCQLPPQRGQRRRWCVGAPRAFAVVPEALRGACRAPLAVPGPGTGRGGRGVARGRGDRPRPVLRRALPSAPARAARYRGGDPRGGARGGRDPRLGPSLRSALGHSRLRGDGRQRAPCGGHRGGERSHAQARRRAPRERVARHQRGVGGARRVVRGRDQRDCRLAPRDVPETVAGGAVRALPGRPAAPQPYLTGDPGHDPRSRRGSCPPRSACRTAPGARPGQGAVRPLGPARAGPSRQRRFRGWRRADRVPGGGGPHRRVVRRGRPADGRFRADDGAEALDRGDGGRAQAPRRLLHRLRQVSHPARIHDLYGRCERRHHPRPRGRPRIPLVG